MAIKSNNNVFLKVTVRIDEEGAMRSLDRYLNNAEKKIKEKGLSILGDPKSGGADKTAKDLDKIGKSAKNATKELTFMEKVMKVLTGRSESLGWAIGGNFLKFASWGAMAGIFYGITNSIGEAISYVSELDQAYTNLAITTDYTNDQILEVDKSVSGLTDKLGKLKTEVINAITEFARAGYSLQDSFILAEQAIIFSNIGQMDVAKSTEILVAGLKAYRMEAEEASRITDVLFEVARKASIDPEGIGEAFLRSANTFYEAGATLEESAALIAAANESIQDPAKIGTALKTIAARLRGVDADSSLPLLQQSLARIGVQIIDVDGGFRNIYDIMKDLSVAFKDLDELTKQGIMEQLAGKRQINILQGLIANFDTAELSLTAALNSTGIAAEKNAQYLDSIAGKTVQFKNAVNELYQTIISSDLIKAVVDIGTFIIKFLNEIIKLQNELLSGIPGIISGIALIGVTIQTILGNIAAMSAGLIVGFPALIPVFIALAGAGLVLKNTYDLLKPSTENLTDETERLNKATKDFNNTLANGNNKSKEALKENLEQLIKQRKELEKQLELAKQQPNFTGKLSFQYEVKNIERQIKANDKAFKEMGTTAKDAEVQISKLNESILKSDEYLRNHVDILISSKASIGGYAQQYNMINDAMNEYNENGGLTKQTITDISTLIPNLVEKMQLEGKTILEVLAAEKAAVKGKIDARISDLKSDRDRTKEAVENAKTRIKALLAESAASPVEMYTQYANIRKALTELETESARLKDTNNTIFLLENEKKILDNILTNKEKSAKKDKEKIALTKEEIALEKIKYEISLREEQLKNATGEDKIRLTKELIKLYQDEIKAIELVNSKLPKQIKDQDKLRQELNKNNLEIEKIKNTIIKYNLELQDLLNPIKQLESQIDKLTKKNQLLNEQYKNAPIDEQRKILEEQIKIATDQYKAYEDIIKLLPEQITNTEELADAIMDYRIKQEQANNAVYGFQDSLRDLELQEAKNQVEGFTSAINDMIKELKDEKKLKLESYDLAIEKIREEINALEEANDLEDERIKRLELQNELLGLREKRQNILNEKNVKIVRSADVGFEISSDPREIAKVNEDILKAEENLAKFERDVERNRLKQQLEERIRHQEELKRLAEESYDREIDALELHLENINKALQDNQPIQEGIIKTMQDSLKNIEGNKYTERLNALKAFISEYNTAMSSMKSVSSGGAGGVISTSSGTSTTSGSLSQSSISGMSDNQFTYLNNLIKTGTAGQAAWAKAELAKPSAASLDQSSNVNINNVNVTSNNPVQFVNGISNMAKLS